MLSKACIGLPAFGALFWLLILFGLLLAPGADARALTSTENTTTDHLAHAFTDITKLMRRDVGKACDISYCDIDDDLCHDDDSNGGDDYDDDCDQDNLEDCPPDRYSTMYSARRSYRVTLQSGKEVVLLAMYYPSVGKVLKKAKGGKYLVYPFAFQPEDSSDCENTVVAEDQIGSSGPPKSTVTEHILELQTLSLWMGTVSSRSLKSKVDDQCFSDFWTSASLPANVPKMQSGTFKTYRVPNDRVFEALGSFRNRGVFLVADSQVNAVKTRIWSGVAIFDDSDVSDLVDHASESDENAGKAMAMLLMPILVFDYLNNDHTSERLYLALDGVSEQMQLIEQNISKCAGLSDSWNEYMTRHLSFIADSTYDWAQQKALQVYRKVKEASQNDPSNTDLQARSEAVRRITETLLDALDDKVKVPDRP